mmetsp:Transcript_21717/g.47344  ORF Transcript_21717/g.47344 Transcript_21717/m.47344 type:complete len:498 (-) Transcript_21717:1383-2876(-)
MPPNVPAYHAVGVGDVETRGAASLEVDTVDEIDANTTPHTILNHDALPSSERAVRFCTLTILTGCIITAALRFMPPYRHSAAECPTLLWADEFDATDLDLTKWSYIDGDGCDVGLCGWGNNELEIYSEDNLVIRNGTLSIEARVDNKGSSSTSETLKYTSAKISTLGKADFRTIGRRFEARIKLPRGQGIWPAFWMLPSKNKFGTWPKSGEIDIMENIGKEGPNTIHGTIHYGEFWPKDQYAEQGIRLDDEEYGDLSATYHTYAVEVDVGVIRWYVDNILYSTKTRHDIMPYRWPFHEEFYFILNLAVGGNWPGFPDSSTTFPQEMSVDYVRVYSGRLLGVEGRAVVESNTSGELYKVVDGRSPGATASAFIWTVPDGATIEKGQGTGEIEVSFSEKGGIIYVERANIDETSTCNVYKAGIRVNVFANDDRFDFDCECSEECTAYVLNRVAGVDYTCGERIKWLIDHGDAESDACKQISVEEFNGRCGACNPERCRS